jgi:hypothetical protein
MDQGYKGWKITYSANRPVTGTWRAERHGVGMCAGTREALQRMVDAKVSERYNFVVVY